MNFLLAKNKNKKTVIEQLSTPPIIKKNLQMFSVHQSEH